MQTVWSYAAPLPVHRIAYASPQDQVFATAAGFILVNQQGQLLEHWRGQRQLGAELLSEASQQITLDAGYLHSAWQPLPNGNTMLLASTALGVGRNDEILEVSRSGKIVSRWRPSELLRGSDAPALASNFVASGLVYDSETQLTYVSFSSPTGLASLDRDNGSMQWHFGAPPAGLAQPNAQLPPQNLAVRQGLRSNLLALGQIDDASVLVDLSAPQSASGLALRYTDPGPEPAFFQHYVLPASVPVADEVDLVNRKPVGWQATALPRQRYLAAPVGGDQLFLFSRLQPEPQPLAQFSSAVQGVAAEETWAVTDIAGFSLSGAIERSAMPSEAAAVQYSKPNVRIANADITGAWELVVGAAEVGEFLGLSVQQSDSLLTGVLDQERVTGWIKGNTFSLTLRVKGQRGGQIRYKYRGVVADDGQAMRGSLFISDRTQPLAKLSWQAKKIG